LLETASVVMQNYYASLEYQMIQRCGPFSRSESGLKMPTSADGARTLKIQIKLWPIIEGLLVRLNEAYTLGVKASKQSQEKLLALANLDSSILQITHKIKSLPLIKALEAKTQELLLTKDLKVAAETELSDVKHELSRCEVDVEQVVSRIEKDEKRLSSGLGTPKELEQLQHELGSLAKRRSELEDVELEVMVRVEALQERINALDSKISALSAEIEFMKSDKEREISELENAKQKNELDRGELATSIENELIALYEKIRSASEGVGAARLAGSQCEGCHLTLNAAELAKVKALADDEVFRCEECRCILIRV
jgi:predicted  nucleic acid-binding Zn-ribbon protein